MGMSKHENKVVRAHEFVIEDQDGNERAALRIDNNEDVVMHFKDALGRSRLLLSLSPEGAPSIRLLYPDGSGAIELDADHLLHSASVTVSGPEGDMQLMMGIDQDGQPSLTLINGESETVFPFGVQEPCMCDSQ